MAEEEAAEVEAVNDAAGGSAYALMTDSWPTCVKVSTTILIIIIIIIIIIIMVMVMVNE